MKYVVIIYYVMNEEEWITMFLIIADFQMISLTKKV